MCWQQKHCWRPRGSFEHPQIPNTCSFSPFPSTSLTSSVLGSGRRDHGIAEVWGEELLPWAGPYSHSELEVGATPATPLARSRWWPLIRGDQHVGFL